MKKYMKSKEGDINAQLELFKAHLRFVPFIAKKFVKRVNHLFYLDLIQVGNMALWRSIQTYDPNKGLLTTYAGVAIERFIEYEIDKFEKEGSLPIYIQQAKRKYNYILKTEGEKTDGEWLEELKSYSIREDALDYVKSDKELEFTSINRLEDSGVDIEYLSSFEPDYASYIANKTANYELFIFLKDKLNPFEYYILYYSTLINEKKYRIKTASIFDVTYQAVCSKEKQVLKKVRHLINRKEKILKSIKEREGKLYYKIKTEPIHPDDVEKYLYLKKYFVGVDLQILYEMFFGKYNLSDLEYARYFDMSLKEYLNRIKAISDKIDLIMQNETDFITFTNVIKEYHTKIYRIALNSEYILSLEYLPGKL